MSSLQNQVLSPINLIVYTAKARGGLESFRKKRETKTIQCYTLRGMEQGGLLLSVDSNIASSYCTITIQQPQIGPKHSRMMQVILSQKIKPLFVRLPSCRKTAPPPHCFRAICKFSGHTRVSSTPMGSSFPVHNFSSTCLRVHTEAHVLSKVGTVIREAAVQLFIWHSHTGPPAQLRHKSPILH